LSEENPLWFIYTVHLTKIEMSISKRK
jgi:hypothetical protein